MKSLDLTPHRLVIGDRIALVEKLNAMQADLEAYSIALNALAEEVRLAHDATMAAAEVIAGNVFDDSQMSVLTGWTSQKISTELVGKVDNSRVLTDVPEGAVFTDTRDADAIVQSAMHRFVTDEEKARWAGLRNARFEQKYFGGM